MLTEDEIRRFMEEDILSDKKRKAKEGQRYYDAEHDILQYRIFYYNADGVLTEDKARSNSRICHPFFTELVDQEVQYMLSGKDGFVKSDLPELQEKMDIYFNENEDFAAELYELLTGASASFLICIKSSTDTPRISARFGRELMSGQDRSRSHLDTALSVTPIFSASSSWVIPCCFLSSAIIVPSVFFIIYISFRWLDFMVLLYRAP